MSSDNKFWISVWAVVGIVIMSVALMITLYWIDHNAKIAEMVRNGTDPVAAMCAMQDDYGVMPVCLVLAAKK